MSYTTPIETTTEFKDLEVKLQNYSAKLKEKLTWLSYAFGLADTVVELKDNRPYIYPVIYQDSNSKEMLSLMPSDLHQSYCFWVGSDAVTPEYDWKRLRYDVSLIFYCDMRDIAPTENWKLTRTKLRQDILEALRQTKYSGLGVLNMEEVIEDDITKVFDGYSLDAIDNKYKIYPKYCIRINFICGVLRQCSSFNTYS